VLTSVRLTESDAPPAGGGGSPATDGLLWATMLSTAAICAPFFRYVQWLGDEGVVLHGADRILRGERLYGEFFEFIPPGSFLIVAAWMQLISSSFAAMRVLAIGVIVAIAGLTYTAARLTSGSRVLAALLGIMWAVQSQGAWTVINHHWFATAASMASAVALLAALSNARDGQTAIFLAGLFAGTAAMILPPQGALLCLAAIGLAATRPDRRRAVLVVVGGLAAFPIAVLVYLVVTGSIVPAVYDVIIFPARHYTDIEVVRFGAFSAPHHAPAVVFLPLTFVLAGAVAVLDGRALWREALFRGALALAVVALLSAFPRPDLAHINFVLPLACPLFALVTGHLLRRLGRHERVTVSVALLALVGVIIGYATYKKIVPIVAGPPLRPVSTARGIFLAPPSSWVEAVAALVADIERTPATDPFFFYPYSPMLPYLTAREHIAPHDVMIPGHTTAEQYREVCLRVVRDAQWIVVDRSWSDPRVLRVFYPNMRVPDPPEKREFEAALRFAFDKIVHVSPVFELRHRAETTRDTSCARI
jgi:hypothetical protein